MAGKLMMPAQPPLPTIWNFPFQLSAGSHNSILMSESAEGFRVAATRQCAGSITGGCAPARPGACGGCQGPAGTDSTAVSVVAGSDSERSCSQGVCAKASEAEKLAR